MTRESDQGPFFLEKDYPLREDVGALATILGRVLKEQGGEELFTRVEQARTLAIEHRHGGEETGERIVRSLSGLDPQQAIELTRAFSTYFGLVNLAERIHRIRRVRSYLRDESTPQSGSVARVVRDLRDSGVHVEEIQSCLETMRVVPVFTAHPTEVVRRTLLVKEQRMARALVDRIDRGVPLPLEERAALARIHAEISAAWQTEEHLQEQPTVYDEMEHVGFYVANVIYRVIPAFYRSVGRALRLAYGTDQAPKFSSPMIRFASWVGGDMDGNPNVGPDTIRETLRRNRALILSRYEKDLEDLFERLSHSTSRVGVSAALMDRIAALELDHPDVDARFSVRYRQMPYRKLIALMLERLNKTALGEGPSYKGPEEFLDDLNCIASSMTENRGANAGLYHVQRLTRCVQTFGFHMATLDVRQDALVHRAVVAEILGDDDYPNRDAFERTKRLERAIMDGGVTSASSGPQPEAVEVIKAIEEVQRAYGAEAVGPYIISMAQGPDDALAVLFLAVHAGLKDDCGAVPLDIAPLFETVTDLEGSEATMEALYTNQSYREHLRHRGNVQTIMLGYSDSSKDSGIVSSRWALYQAQERLIHGAKKHGISLTLFHGRGGTLSRGGTKTRAGILSTPAGGLDAGFRVTEQGEIIHAKYGLRGIALRTLELMVGSVLEHRITAQDRDEPKERWVKALNEFAGASRKSYRALVYEHPDFYAFFRHVTPIDVIERMRIGSRPSSRRAQKGIEDLRAIPWVFSWTQSRYILPGWFGVGEGLAQLVKSVGVDEVQQMDQSWPFFHTLLSDIEMVLAKSDLAIADHYATLAPENIRGLHQVIKDEFRRTCALLCQIRGTKKLLENDQLLGQSIDLRNPYIDPMSLIQVDLLRRWRAGGRSDADVERALNTTVKGIARGLQNTG